MLTLNAGPFFEVIDRIGQTSAWIAASKDRQGGTFQPDKRLDDIDRKYVEARMNGIAEHLEILGARLTAISVLRVQERLSREWATWGDVRDCFDEIRGRLKDELTLTKVFAIEAEKHPLFDPPKPIFGDEFATKFLSAAFELDEAAKCLALSRPTASVFHLMRMMEIGIRAVARCLNISDPIKPAERNWGHILGKIWNDGITKKWPTTADRTNGDGAFFEGLYASLDAVKNPWRNATMHVENKYTDDEAEHIFVAVKGFMKKLASRCDENGDPKA